MDTPENRRKIIGLRGIILAVPRKKKHHVYHLFKPRQSVAKYTHRMHLTYQYIYINIYIYVYVHINKTIYACMPYGLKVFHPPYGAARRYPQDGLGLFEKMMHQ